MSESAQNRYRIAAWLMLCSALIFVMIVLGGVTRLTRSGLSIVEWQPVIGVVPPLSSNQWHAEFDKYKQTPEYRKVNRGMSLSDFQSIYWVEYAHRLLGRGIGLVFLLGLIYFLIKRQIDRKLAPRLTAIFLLGGLQGALGWYMVASGLVDEPRVSAYRLTAHLGLAVVIYGYIVWVAFGLLWPGGRVPSQHRRFNKLASVLTVLVFVMILSGGFVAGTKAGFAFNTFPLMNGQWLPAGLFARDPWWINLFENTATVQLNHRLLAYVILASIVGYWLALRAMHPSSRAMTAGHLLLAAIVVQALLGILTLLWVVPIPLAAAHQGGAIVVFTAALYALYVWRPRIGP